MGKIYTKKYNKAQHKAISGLVCDLDELDNKPRRLYAALRDFALAFLEEETKHDKKYRLKIINRIDQAERTWYDQANFENEFSEILRGIRRKKNDLTSSLAEADFKEQEKRYAKDAKKDKLDTDIEMRWFAYTRAVEDMAKEATRMVMYNVYEYLDDRYERIG